MTNWHRLFGLLLSDFFAGSPFVVDLEKDLSMMKQLLDVVIVRKGQGEFAGTLPDGLDNLAQHNLITFKSHHEALDDWALKELTGHYVNYRKQVSPDRHSLLPEDEFRLYAVCSTYPRKLASAGSWQSIQTGVFECSRGSDRIGVIVADQLPRTENNALLHLLSASPDQIQYGASHYRQRSSDTSTLLNRLFEGYEREGVPMSYTMEDFRKDYVKEHLKDLTLEERLAGVPTDEIRRLYPDDELLQTFSPAEIKRYLERRQRRPSSRKPKKKR
jgi:hypothetical protein